MICKNCGQENKEHAKFCEKCGSPLAQEETEEIKKDSVQPDQTAASGGLQNHKKRIIGGAILLLILIACIIGFLLYSSNQKQAEYKGKLQTADKYLEQLDYEKAETAYLEAIDIQPKKEDAYLELSDMYKKQGDYDKAKTILEKGAKQTSSSKVESEKVQITKTIKTSDTYYTYLHKKLIPELGQSDIEYKYGEWQEDYFYGWCKNTGIISAYISDLNDDKKDEFIVLYSKPIEDEETSSVCMDGQVNGLYMRVYSEDQEHVALVDEILLISPFDGETCDLNVSVVSVDGLNMIVFDKNNATIGGNVREFAAFEFTKERKLQAKVDLLDPGATSGGGLYAETENALKELDLRNVHINADDLRVLYEFDEMGQTGGSYSSYGEAIQKEFEKIGITVTAEEGQNGFEFSINNKACFKIVNIHSELDYETKALNAEIKDYTSYNTHSVKKPETQQLQW